MGRPGGPRNSNPQLRPILCGPWSRNEASSSFITNRGEPADPFIVLAHELIHALHFLQGIQIDGQDEERWTTGIGIYERNPMSENAFRSQFGLPLRVNYF